MLERALTADVPYRLGSGRRRRPGHWHEHDPVCGMTVATVYASLHLDHDGRRVWFCGSGCLRVFAADPTSYLP